MKRLPLENVDGMQQNVRGRMGKYGTKGRARVCPKEKTLTSQCCCGHHRAISCEALAV